MNRLSVSDLCENEDEYYFLIIVISKIARKIVDEDNDLRNTCPDNPVEDAIEKFAAGEYCFVK